MEKKLMIVDDDWSIRIAVKVLFESHGFEVWEADGANQCLEALRAGFKGVIAMDIMMPDMNGCAAVREIVSQGFFEDNAIFMLTAVNTPEKEMESIQDYVVEYVAKPFDPEDLVSVVEKYLRELEIAEALRGKASWTGPIEEMDSPSI
ncbi:MAG: response regulator [Chloroflexota bacterium]|nr:response regulator [Chloroflexota bacterium]